MACRFYIVDVFAERRYAGNQLAVVVGAAGLSDAKMQQIAQEEMNYSETTFVESAQEHDQGSPDDIDTTNPVQVLKC